MHLKKDSNILIDLCYKFNKETKNNIYDNNVYKTLLYPGAWADQRNRQGR